MGWWFRSDGPVWQSDSWFSVLELHLESGVVRTCQYASTAEPPWNA